MHAATIDASSGSPGSGFTVTSNAASSLVAEDGTHQTQPASLLAWGSGAGLKYAWLSGTSAVGNGSIDPVSPTTYANPTLGYIGATNGATAVLAWEAASGTSQIVRSVAMKDTVSTPTDLTPTTLTALQPALSPAAIAYVVPGSCTSPNCPPGHGTSSRIVLGHLTITTGDVPTLGPTKDLTDPKTVYAEQPRVATIGGGIYIVLWQQLDGSGLGTILGVTRASWSTAGSWTAVPAMGLSQAPAFFVNYAVASDGLRFGVVLDTLNGASWNVLYRSTCP